MVSHSISLLLSSPHFRSPYRARTHVRDSSPLLLLHQITRLSGDGWFDVAYDDGTFETNVPRCRILRVTGELHLSLPLQTLFLASLTRSSPCFSRSDTADDTARQTYARERRRERRLKLKAKRRRRLLRCALPLSGHCLKATSQPRSPPIYQPTFLSRYNPRFDGSQAVNSRRRAEELRAASNGPNADPPAPGTGTGTYTRPGTGAEAVGSRPRTGGGVFGGGAGAGGGYNDDASSLGLDGHPRLNDGLGPVAAAGDEDDDG